MQIVQCIVAERALGWDLGDSELTKSLVSAELTALCRFCTYKERRWDYMIFKVSSNSKIFILLEILQDTWNPLED